MVFIMTNLRFPCTVLRYCGYLEFCVCFLHGPPLTVFHDISRLNLEVRVSINFTSCDRWAFQKGVTELAPVIRLVYIPKL
jgi:hypothetical protein